MVKEQQKRLPASGPGGPSCCVFFALLRCVKERKSSAPAPRSSLYSCLLLSFSCASSLVLRVLRRWLSKEELALILHRCSSSRDAEAFAPRLCRPAAGGHSMRLGRCAGGLRGRPLLG